MRSSSPVVDPAVDPPPGARQLARGITATWWYTVSAVAFLEFFLVLVWTLQALAVPGDATAALVVGVGGVVWWGSTIVLLADYRHRLDAEPGIAWTRIALPLMVAVGYGIAGGLVLDSWLLALMPVAQSVLLLNWPKGVRLRMVVLTTVMLVIVAVVDAARGATEIALPGWIPALYAILIPAMSVSSLWWWDVLVTVDRARASESRLAATQERLRVATDVHDLQGHHLQVIALQLELAERLMRIDPDAALEQLRAARVSVDDARQGTRDLATRFRSVPLGDEVANARDLLAAAGLAVEADIAPDADEAPSSALGPVIRETTTNVLRHGAGRWARLDLRRVEDGWRYEVANDVAGDAAAHPVGSGLDGVRRRISEAGGTLEIREDADEFIVSVTVPRSDGSTADGQSR